MKIYDQEELLKLKSNELPGIYNTFAKIVGAKSKYNMRSMIDGIGRILYIQDVYGDMLNENVDDRIALLDDKEKVIRSKTNPNCHPIKTTKKPDPTKKPKKTRSKFLFSDKVNIIKGSPREGSIEYTIQTAINEEWLETVGEISKYIIANHKRPNSLEAVDEKFALASITYLIKKEHLKLV